MKKPRICAVVTDDNPEALTSVLPLVDLLEVRIDLIGEGWPGVVPQLSKPWIACNRIASEGGGWRGGEAGRVAALLQAVALGAAMVDIELATEDLSNILRQIKGKARCILSYHDLQKTPPLDELKGIVHRQMDAGADISKVVPTALNLRDNLTVLELISAFPEEKLISFAMGPPGSVSRVLCPLVGGEFTYAAIREGSESAAGQLTVSALARIYELMGI